MRSFDFCAAMKSAAFDVRSCTCGKCIGQEHVNLVAKEALLMDVAGVVAQTFAVPYVKIVVAYHCHVRARGVAVSISCEIFAPSGELITRSAPRSFSGILLPHTASGEAKLFGMLHVGHMLVEAAQRAAKKAA